LDASTDVPVNESVRLLMIGAAAAESSVRLSSGSMARAGALIVRTRTASGLRD
jgi:hypothetical protein